MVTCNRISEHKSKIYRINAIGEILAPVQHEYPLHFEALQKLSKQAQSKHYTSKPCPMLNI